MISLKTYVLRTFAKKLPLIIKTLGGGYYLGGVFIIRGRDYMCILKMALLSLVHMLAHLGSASLGTGSPPGQLGTLGERTGYQGPTRDAGRLSGLIRLKRLMGCSDTIL